MRNIRIAVVMVVVFACYCTEGFIGINWGRRSRQRLVPSQAVDLMLQNGIRHVRIFTSQNDIIQAFQNSGIDLIVTIYNKTMPPTQNHATNIITSKYSLLTTCNVRTIIVGGIYIFNQGSPGIPPLDYSMRSLKYVQAALNQAKLGHRIKANFVHNLNILQIGKFIKPSETEFRPDIKDKMVEFVQFLRHNDAPFYIDIIPILDLEAAGIFDISFAFADGKSNLVIHDVDGAVYSNVVHWQYDCFLWALEKLNASDINIIVASIAWPTDGYANASAANAERFYKHLLPMVASNIGTPKRPGIPIDVFISTLADEPKMSYLKPYMRHWGIYRSNGEPKYKIDLSGQGRDIYPTKVKGIMRMPDRWCVFNGDTTDMDKVHRMVARACDKGDCTTLAPGASCSKLSVEKNVSYAFNVYFQSTFQNEEECDFDGIGYITDDDPSTRECVFPVEVAKGRQVMEIEATATHRRPSYLLLGFLLYMILM